MTAESHTDPKQAHAGAERDGTRTRFILAAVVVTTVAVAAVVVGLIQLVSVQVEEEVARKVLQVESTQLRQLRADEEARLTRYQWVDKAQGVLRIPVDRALELTMRDWEKRPAGFVAGAAPPQADPAEPAPAGASQTPSR